MKIVTVIGARPQFVKAAALSHAIQEWNKKGLPPIQEVLVHTGQHYDKNMSLAFFEDMNIPLPDYQLNCGGKSHAEMTATMMIEIEKICLKEEPDYLLVYGDTNSTLAGALTASKLHIPVVHVEAGLRSYNRSMPEEINRVLTDHISDKLFCPTNQAVENLMLEGITKNVFHVGDVMYDVALRFGSLADQQLSFLDQLHVEQGSYYLCTLHRAENTDHKERIQSICSALREIATEQTPVVFPLHPRTDQRLKTYGLKTELEEHPHIRLIPPVSFVDMIVLEKNASYILTDSGGVQKEAYFYQTPCITLRDETEWVETVVAGWNYITGANKELIIKALSMNPQRHKIAEYGEGNAAEMILNKL